MQRLTRRKADGKIVYAGIGPGECVDVIDLLNVYAERLATYEDTGMAPEEINAVLEAEAKKRAELEKKQKLTEATNRQIIENYVPVIRCKNCDMWNTWDSKGRKSLGNYVCSCDFWTKEDGPVAYTRPNDFCSNGARRDNDGPDLR